MNEMNKNHMKIGGKMLLMGVVVLVAIVAFAGNLNAVVANGLESIYAWGASINFIVEIFLIRNLRKMLFKNDECFKRGE